MKIGCHCGATIFDQTDNLPHKAHFIPDQARFATFDALDDKVIDPLAKGELTKEKAHLLARAILSQAARLMWQCAACGRLYVDDCANDLHCYLPAEEGTEKEILRSPNAPT